MCIPVRSMVTGGGMGSRRLAGLQDSIDQPECLGKSIVAPEAHFPRPYGVDGRVDSAPQLLELAGAEHQLPDRGLAAAEHEIVRAEAGDLDLRLLDREEVGDGLGQRA